MQVRILCGGYGVRLAGKGTHLVLKGAVVDLPEDEAKYLIAKGCAEEIRKAEIEPEEESAPEQIAENEPFDADYTAMTVSELRKIAKEKGIQLAARATKAQILEALENRA